MRLLFQIRTFKVWKGWEYPAPHFYHIPAFSHFSKSPPQPSHWSLHRQSISPLHISPPCLPGLTSVYGQCTVTVCQLVTECRPASGGLGPAYKTTYWLQGNYSHCVIEKEKSVSVCVVTTSLTNCTMYPNTAHYKCDSYCSVINHGLEWLRRMRG